MIIAQELSRKAGNSEFIINLNAQERGDYSTFCENQMRANHLGLIHPKYLCSRNSIHNIFAEACTGLEPRRHCNNLIVLSLGYQDALLSLLLITWMILFLCVN